ncbi:MAG: hypothetical protein COC01_01930 [Bacteroidetes bacterium]|nr:DUF4294 domain-containing protein [Bacteroidia bacterium]PCH69275.1 MAG: hypothetical protein COC01_01930 [Bacteroidota bacterium]
MHLALAINMRELLFISILTLSFVGINAQEINYNEISKMYAYNKMAKGYIVYGSVVNGDTVPSIQLNTLHIWAKRSKKDIRKSKRKKARYDRLARDVRKVYPMARVASAKLKYINNELAKLETKSERKSLLKEKEKELLTEYEDDIRTMTFRQGRILIKLIDRETGSPSYDLIRDLRGSTSAFFWQAIARIFGSNLKWEYDPEEEKAIEAIIQSI